jgi:hypothetical protein
MVRDVDMVMGSGRGAGPIDHEDPRAAAFGHSERRARLPGAAGFPSPVTVCPVAVMVEVPGDAAKTVAVATPAPVVDAIADPGEAASETAPIASRTLARGRVTSPRVARARVMGSVFSVRMVSTPVEPPRPGEALPTVRQPEDRPGRLSGGLRRRIS